MDSNTPCTNKTQEQLQMEAASEMKAIMSITIHLWGLHKSESIEICQAQRVYNIPKTITSDFPCFKLRLTEKITEDQAPVVDFYDPETGDVHLSSSFHLGVNDIESGTRETTYQEDIALFLENMTDHGWEITHRLPVEESFEKPEEKKTTLSNKNPYSITPSSFLPGIIAAVLALLSYLLGWNRFTTFIFGGITIGFVIGPVLHHIIYKKTPKDHHVNPYKLASYILFGLGLGLLFEGKSIFTGTVSKFTVLASIMGFLSILPFFYHYITGAKLFLPNKTKQDA